MLAVNEMQVLNEGGFAIPVVIVIIDDTKAQVPLSGYRNYKCIDPLTHKRAKGAFYIRKNGVTEAFAMPWHRVGHKYACYTRKRNAPGSNPTASNIETCVQAIEESCEEVEKAEDQ